LHLELADPLADRLALAELAEWCQQFSPSVALEEAEATRRPTAAAKTVLPLKPKQP
jgi:hypothetical protein